MSLDLEGRLPLMCLMYLDDNLVMGQTFEQHRENLKAVLEPIIKAGLKLNPSRCHFTNRV